MKDKGVEKVKGCSGCRRKKFIDASAIDHHVVTPIDTGHDKGPDSPTIEIEKTEQKRKSLMDYNADGKNYQKIYLATNLGKVSVAKFMAEVESWIGSGYEHLGQTRHGTDCIGLVLGVYKNLGLIPRDVSPGEYAKQWYLEQDLQVHPAFDGLKKAVKVVKIEKIDDFLPGDIVVFQFGRATEAHVALYTSRKSFIHAVASPVRKGSVIESRGDDKTFSKRISYAYRLQEGEI